MATEKFSIESAEAMKTAITKSTNVGDLVTGAGYIFEVEEWKTDGGGKLYSFHIVNHYGEIISNGSWLLSKATVDEIKHLFDWGQDE
jgi:hypothetical protein